MRLQQEFRRLIDGEDMSACEGKGLPFVGFMKIVAHISLDCRLRNDERRDLQRRTHLVRRQRQMKRRIVELEEAAIRRDGRLDVQRIASKPRTHEVPERRTAKHGAKL